MYIPPSHQNVMVYLILKNALGFVNFTKKVFDATLLNSHVMEGSDKIMHGEVQIGSSTIMFAETTHLYPVQNSHFFIYVDDVDVIYQEVIDFGGISITKVAEQEYGRSGGVMDPFGNTWWITTMQEK